MSKSNIIDVQQLPLLLSLDDLSPEDFISYYLNNRKDIEEKLLKYGAIKFKGIRINDLKSFQHIVNSISDKFLNYIDGNSPRIKLSGHVYTSTEYDKTQKITMHNELSYSAKWPNKLFFNCLIPAETGGETLLADSRKILQIMDQEIIKEIESKGVMYIRNLNGGISGMGVTWQETFETDDKELVEQYCKSNGIDYEWTNKDNLRIKQYSKGIITHRVTGEKIWFNQIDQFHPCHLGEEIFESMKIIYDSPECFPMYVKFGDGTEISESFVKEILSTIEKVTIAPKWDKDELLIVDNEMVSHGRNSFTGKRHVIVAMSE
ncbi:TauD/TfdA family dioxygenase [Aquimarina sp. 2304DJ70-9]|uniref:TauD/TfdA family dioxygenase n=1 Tax=Aquimarina penaris TaxID=3231044 RepID=UPI003461A3F1